LLYALLLTYFSTYRFRLCVLIYLAHFVFAPTFQIYKI